MKFAKKASTLLDGIRRSRRTRKHRVVEESAIVEDGVPIGVPAVTLQPSVRASQRIASREGASTAKRGRRRMGHTAVYIHEDGDVDFDATRSRKKRAMEAEDRGHHVAVQEIQNDVPSDATSEEEDEDEDIDESVADDMRHLEESFQGISHKYRLINRIGEGTVLHDQHLVCLKLTLSEVLSRQSTKLRCSLTRLKTKRMNIPTQRPIRSSRYHQLRGGR